MTMTNGIGNTHGVVIQEASTVLSGGAHSTTMTLSDTGASFSNAQTGAAVVVSGVANGVSPTDAANVGQVNAAIDAAVAPFDARLASVESNIQALDKKIGGVEKKVSGGVAIAMALTQPLSFAPKADTAVTVGVASYNGQSAAAVGYNRLIQNSANRRVIVSGGVGVTTTGQSAARAGISFSW
jgi:autotransporter adhesin